MRNSIEKAKTFIKENKKEIVIAGVGIVVGAGVGVIAISCSKSGPNIVQTINQIAWRPENYQVVITLIEKSTLSKPVHLVGTNLYFDSLSDAARKTGHHLSMISRHVNGQIPDLNGDVFELLQPA